MHTNIQAVNYGVGVSPISVAIADLNNDSILDIVTANCGSKSVSMLIGNPTGTFSPSSNSLYSVGTQPYLVAIADLNNDGILDIATANFGSNSVSVLIGNPAGTFSPSPNSPYSVGANPRSLAIADLNKDGNLDIITANYAANSISILQSVVWNFTQTIFIGTNPHSVAIADFNNDASLDIVVANSKSNSVLVLFGNPAGTFSPSPNSSYPVGANPCSIIIADLNKDGYLDIVTANYDSHSVSVLIGNSAGTFSLYSYSVGKSPYSVAIEDLNKDCHLDIVTANNHGHSVSVLLGNPAGTFSPSPNSPYSVGRHPHSVAVADLNNDDHLDIVTANLGADSVTVLFGMLDGPFSQSIDKVIAQELGQAMKEQKLEDLKKTIKNIELELVTKSQKLEHLEETIEDLKLKLVTKDQKLDQVETKVLEQYKSTLQHYQKQLSELQEIINDQKDNNILYPLIIAGSLVIGAQLGPTLFKGAAMGVLFGTAACILHSYADITDYVAKLIGDDKPEDL